MVQNELVTVPDKDEQEKPIKRRKLCKIENKKVQDEDEQGNPPTTSAQIISVSTTPVPDVEIREVDPYNPMWKVDPKLWKEYLQWKKSEVFLIQKFLLTLMMMKGCLEELRGI